MVLNSPPFPFPDFTADVKIMRKIFAERGKFFVFRQRRGVLLKNFASKPIAVGINNHKCNRALSFVGIPSLSPPRKFPSVSTLISLPSFSFLRHLHTSGEQEKKGHSTTSLDPPFSPLLCLCHLLFHDKFIPRRPLRVTAFILSLAYHISHI